MCQWHDRCGWLTSGGLIEVFDDFRDEVSRLTSVDAAGESYKLAQAYFDAGMSEEAIEALKMAACSPRYRFDAASWLGRLCRQRGMTGDAVLWLARAADAPAPTVDAGCAVLYELGEALEGAGDIERARTTFSMLLAAAPDYRDVRQRLDRVSRT